MASVGDLTRILFEAFPASDAEPWDKVGLVVGDPHVEVERIAVALDATAGAIRAAAERGAQVLVTHHPVFIDQPERLVPGVSADGMIVDAIFEAVRSGVSLIAMHTNLDRSEEARTLHACLLGLDVESELEKGREGGALGIIARVTDGEKTLDDLARSAANAYGTDVVMHGAPQRVISRVAISSGSIGSLVDDAIAAGVDAVITGECGYHGLLALEDKGIAVILVGHGPSEVVYDSLLEDTLEAALGEDAEAEIVVLKRSRQRGIVTFDGSTDE